jgi:sugar lactone lactonase YvrE
MNLPYFQIDIRMKLAMPVEFLVSSANRLAESPVWDDRDNCVYWVDIPANRVHALDLASRHHRYWTFEHAVGSLGLTQSNRLVVAIGGAVHLFDPKRETLDLLARLETDFPKLRLNDGKVGPDGAFWVGSMDNRPEKEAIGALYRVTADGGVTRMISDIVVSNGLAWSPDGLIMFHSDSRGPWIDRWEFDAKSGSIGGRQRIATLTEEEGRPDGAACDTENGYWSCGVSAGRLNRFDRTGALLARVAMPVPHPTMLCFGGKDMRTVFVTSLREGLAPERLVSSPHSGRLFAIDLGCAGVPIERFND